MIEFDFSHPAMNERERIEVFDAANAKGVQAIVNRDQQRRARITVHRSQITLFLTRRLIRARQAAQLGPGYSNVDTGYRAGSVHDQLHGWRARARRQFVVGV